MLRFCKNPVVSVVFITYNRSELLKKTVESILPTLNELDFCCEILIGDDSSSQPHQDNIKKYRFGQYIKTDSNVGLGANTNNVLKSTNGDFILQVQDDWRWLGDVQLLSDCISFMTQNNDIGILQMTDGSCDIKPKIRQHRDREFSVYINDHIPWVRSCSTRPYSDQPHIKRREFIADIGPYLEGVSMGVTENNFKKRVANQKRWRVSSLDGANAWEHLGSEESFNTSGSNHAVFKFLSKFGRIGSMLVKLIRLFRIKVEYFLAHVLGG